jgi:hypothetical protein
MIKDENTPVAKPVGDVVIESGAQSKKFEAKDGAGKSGKPSLFKVRMQVMGVKK